MSARHSPGAGEGPKGWAVRPLKWHASWVQKRRETVRSLSIVGVGVLRGADTSTRGPCWTDSGLPVVPPGAPLGI